MKEIGIEMLTRRTVLRASALALGGVALGCGKRGPAKNPEMTYRKLGNTGLEVSEIGFGAEWMVRHDQAECTALARRCEQYGINIVDCWMGDPEVRDKLGNALAGHRKDWIIQGHVCSNWQDGKFEITRDVAKCRKSFADLLQRLKTDYIDIGMIFLVDKVSEWEEIATGPLMDYMRELKATGRIRHIGLSTHNPQVGLAVAKSGLVEMMLFCINPAYDLLPPMENHLNLFNDETFDSKLGGIAPERAELYRLCAAKGIGLTVMKAYAGGRLLDAARSPFKVALSPVQCLHYALTRPAVASVLVGYDTPEHVDAAAYYEKSTPAERDYASVLAAAPRHRFDGECTYCDHCAPCSVGIPIGTVNKLYDLAVSQTTIPDSVREHYASLKRHAGDCTGCGLCEKRCPFHVKVIERMRAAAKLFASWAGLLLAQASLIGATSLEAASLEDLARADYAHAIRPGGVEGAPFWNVYARMFMYPPAFDFSKGGPGTVKYRFTVFDAAGKTHTFDAPSSQSPLTPVWNDVAPGQAWVYVAAVDKDGGIHGIPDWPRDRFSRTFWRSAPFRPGTYAPAPRSYAEAVAKCGDEIFERPANQYFLKTGKPDPAYKHNCYPSKMHAALIDGMLGYALARPERATEALKLARNAADHLIASSQPAGTPLEYWPPTYADKREAGAFRFGQIMLIYPCRVGEAYLALYRRVKDVRYLAAAKRIGDTYLRLQEKDGTWSIFMRESDGKVLSENRVQPTGVITFLEALYKACGDEKYRVSADRAFAWIEAHPLKDWFWEGQFEDSPLIAKYENPSKHPACELAIYLVGRYPSDRKWMAVARDLVRYAEDQFVCWEKPCAANGHGVNTPIGNPFQQQNRYNDWFYPCALEQYVYYVPVDASNAKMIRTYLALYRAERDPLDLAKAKALGDALVRTQQPSGYIPTEYAKVENRSDPMQGWLNCTCATLAALSELAQF